MKRKPFLFSLMFVVLCVSTGTAQVDQGWHCWQVQVSGIDSFQRADYLSRGLEKMDLALFSAYSVHSGDGYIISSMPNIDNIVSYVNNWDRGFTINTFEGIVLTDSLFLSIYLLRRNIAPDDMYDQELPFVKLGPKRELSILLYNIASTEWKRRYNLENQ